MTSRIDRVSLIRVDLKSDTQLYAKNANRGTEVFLTSSSDTRRLLVDNMVGSVLDIRRAQLYVA